MIVYYSPKKFTIRKKNMVVVQEQGLGMHRCNVTITTNGRKGGDY